MSDNENIDIKSRLGRKRLRTSSQKSLENELPEEMPGRPPTGELRAVSDESMMPPPPMAVPAPGMPSMPSPVAPVAPEAAPVNINMDFVPSASSKKVLIIVAICCALPAFGLGYCSGHRVEQNMLVNKATEDAKNLKATFDLINNDLVKFQSTFAAPPSKISDWLNVSQELAIKDPDFGELAGLKLNYIATPKQRRDFMGNLVTFYSLLILIKDEYNRFLGHLAALEAAKAVVQEMDKIAEKQIVAESKDEYLLNVVTLLRSYVAKVITGRVEEAAKEIKNSRFVMLWDGSVANSKVVPLQAEMIACPSEKKEKCEESDKVVNFQGVEYPFSVPKDAKVESLKLAIRFGELAPGAIETMVKSEIIDPMVPKWTNLVESFFKLQKYIKDATEISSKLTPILDQASKRKKRGIF